MRPITDQVNRVMSRESKTECGIFGTLFRSIALLIWHRKNHVLPEEL